MKYLLIILLSLSFAYADLIRIWAGANTSGDPRESDFNIWAIGKHFIPLVPNARIEYDSINYKSDNQSKKMQRADVIAYYNFLDNLLWLTLDLGVGVSINAKEKDITKPFVFARTRANIPATDLGFEASVKYLKLGSSEMQNTIIKADWEVFDILVLDFAIEGGYKKTIYNMPVENININNEKFFIGLSTRF